MATGTSLGMTRSPREKLLEELRNRDYRRAFVSSHAGDSIAFQLKAMRRARNMEQRDVAAKLGNPALQPMISRYENPDYGKYSVKTLLELADAFDVALSIHFAPFSELVEWDLKPVSQRINPPSFDDDEGLWGEGGTSTTSLLISQESSAGWEQIDDRDDAGAQLELGAQGTQEQSTPVVF